MSIVEIEHEKYLKNLKRKGSVLVCPRFTGRRLFLDNLIRKCEGCKYKIQLRPYNEIANKKICVECVSKMDVEKAMANDKAAEEIIGQMLKRGVAS